MLKKISLGALVIFIMQAAHADDSITLTLANHSHYVLFTDSTQSDYENACQAATGAACKNVLATQDSQSFTLKNGDTIYLGFTSNPTQGNYFGTSISYNGKDIKYGDLKLPNTTLKLNNNILDLQATDTPIEPAHYEQIPFRGINLSGAEAAGNYLNFWTPGYEDIAPYITTGVNTVRYPIRLEYVTDPETAATYLPAIKSEIADLLAQHINVILDLHNYMHSFALGQPTTGNAPAAPLLTPQDMTSIWAILASQFHDLATQYDGSKTSNQLLFEVMNEPNQMSNDQVLANTNAAIGAIRAANLNNLILIEGNSWSGLHSWTSSGNAATLTPSNIKDSANNWAIAVHQYFDTIGPYSGTGTTCADPVQFQSDLNFNDFMSYVKQYKVKVFLDEFGIPNKAENPNVCAQDLKIVLSDIHQNPYTPATGGFLGWTAWEVNHGYTETNLITPEIWQDFYLPNF